jgi:hypothetical protein
MSPPLSMAISRMTRKLEIAAPLSYIDVYPGASQSAAGLWGHSSVGRALEWHSRGRRFDSAWLHQTNQRLSW